PRANPDASAAGRPRSTPDGWAGCCRRNRSPRRRSLAERAASSVRRFSKSLLLRALSAILTPPARRWRSGFPPLKAARTLLIGRCLVKNLRGRNKHLKRRVNHAVFEL